MALKSEPLSDSTVNSFFFKKFQNKSHYHSHSNICAYDTDETEHTILVALILPLFVWIPLAHATFFTQCTPHKYNLLFATKKMNDSVKQHSKHQNFHLFGRILLFIPNYDSGQSDFCACIINRSELNRFGLELIRSI